MHLQYLGGSTVISDIVIGGGTMPVLRKRTNPFWGRPAEEKHALSAHLRQGSGGGSGNTDRLLAKLQTDVTDIISIIKSNEVQMVDVGDAKVGVLRLARQQAGDSDAPMPLSVGALADQLSTTLRTQLRELTTVIKAQMSEKKTGNVGGGGGGVSTNDLKLIQSDLKAIKASVADSDGKATTDRLVDISKAINDMVRNAGTSVVAATQMMTDIKESVFLVNPNDADAPDTAMNRLWELKGRFDTLDMTLNNQNASYLTDTTFRNQWQTTQAAAMATLDAHMLKQFKMVKELAKRTKETKTLAMPSAGKSELADVGVQEVALSKFDKVVDDLSTKLTAQLADSEKLQTAMTAVNAKVDAFTAKVADAKTPEAKLTVVTDAQNTGDTAVAQLAEAYKKVNDADRAALILQWGVDAKSVAEADVKRSSTQTKNLVAKFTEATAQLTTHQTMMVRMLDSLATRHGDAKDDRQRLQSVKEASDFARHEAAFGDRKALFSQTVILDERNFNRFKESNDFLVEGLTELDDANEERADERLLALNKGLVVLADMSTKRHQQSRLAMLSGFSDLMMLIPSSEKEAKTQNTRLLEGRDNAYEQFLLNADSFLEPKTLAEAKALADPAARSDAMRRLIAFADSKNTNIAHLVDTAKKTRDSLASHQAKRATARAAQASADQKQGQEADTTNPREQLLLTNSSHMSDQYYSTNNQQSFMSWAFGGLFRQSDQSPQQPPARQSTPLSNDDLGRHRIGTQGNHGSCISV